MGIRRTQRVVLEGRVVIHECGCWSIRRYQDDMLLRFQACSGCIEKGLDIAEKLLYLDKVDSVSGPVEVEEQLWLT